MVCALRFTFCTKHESILCSTYFGLLRILARPRMVLLHAKQRVFPTRLFPQPAPISIHHPHPSARAQCMNMGSEPPGKKRCMVVVKFKADCITQCFVLVDYPVTGALAGSLGGRNCGCEVSKEAAGLLQHSVAGPNQIWANLTWERRHHGE